jgi:acetyl-CoA synthetase
MAAAWQPPAEVIAAAQVTRLARELGCADFATLHRCSVEQPAAYWRHLMGFLGIAWSLPPQGYVVLPEGPAFPNWFPGGELNWVDSIFRWGRDPVRQGSPVIIAEREDGSVGTIDLGELETRALGFAAGLRAQGLGRGDRVALLMETGVEAVVSFLSISALGAICVPLFSGFGVEANLGDHQEAVRVFLDAEFSRLRVALIAEGGAVDEAEMRVVKTVFHQSQASAVPHLVEFVDATESLHLLLEFWEGE